MNVSMIWSNKSSFTGCDNTVGFPKSGHIFGLIERGPISIDLNAYIIDI